MKKWFGLIPVFIFLIASCAPVVPSSNQGIPSETAAPTFTALPPTVSAPTSAPMSSTTPAINPTIAFTASASATCQVSPVVPGYDTLAENNIPVPGESDHAYGTATSSVTILSYCNFQSTTCRTLVTNLAELQTQFPQDVRVVLRQYPQPLLADKSLIAAFAAEAAALENRFWEMNNLLYASQADWVNLTPAQFSAWLVEQVPALGITAEKWAADMSDPRVSASVEKVIQDAAPLSISSTPILFFNNILVKTGVDTESLSVLVKYFLLPKKAYTACPPQVIDPTRQYYATFKTEKGNIVFELLPEIAPVAVNSFVFLAKAGWYDGSGFFQVVPGFVAQGGDPSDSGLGTPGYTFSRETNPSVRFDQAGILALGHDSEGMNGSQFFITYAALPELDGEFTIIGRVVEGMDVLNALRPRNPQQDELLLPADKLLSITIEEK